MQFKYDNIIWVFLGLVGIVLIFLPFKQENEPPTSQNTPRVKQNEKNGEISSYDDNGRLKTKVNYINGVKNGFSYLYYKDGKTVQLAIPYVNGKREGISKKYYEDGTLYAETSYQNDVLDGIRTLYYSNGRVKTEIPYGYGHVGVGLKEYLLNGKEKTQNEISLTKNGNIIYLSTAQPCTKAKFYVGELIEDKYLDIMSPNVQSLPDQDAQFFIDLNTYHPSYLELQDIICSCKSNQGNPLILKRRIDALSLKNVNQ